MRGEGDRAPALFAVLLGAAGLGPQLLRLLAEPARAAVKGLSITARRRHPSHSAAFLAGIVARPSGQAVVFVVREFFPVSNP